MQKFKDSKGEEWKVEINMGTIDPIERETGVDLLLLDRRFLTAEEQEDPSKRKWLDENGDPMPLAIRLQCDDRLLYSLIYATCMAQVEGRNISPEEFGERVGSVYQEAEKAWFTELGNFYLSLGKPALKEILDQAQTIFGKLYQEQTKIFSEMDPDKVVTEAIEQAQEKSGGKPTKTKPGDSKQRGDENSGQSEESSAATSGLSLRVSSTG